MAWMIYGATGYTGVLIAREAVARGLSPVLAGRSEDKTSALATELGLPYRVFGLDDAGSIVGHLDGIEVVLHCAGPFSATSVPMLEACLAARAHYLDITGEISVFEHAYAQDARAREAGIVVCPGVGFDVIPTDCVAARLKAELPDATHLALGFDSRSGFSPGTAKTSVEGLAQGGRVRRDGRMVSVPLAYKTRKIDFGAGEKLAMTIPWGDVSTAWQSTGIPNIEVYIPASQRLVARLRKLNYVRTILRLGFVQNYMKRQVDKTVRGPSDAQRAKMSTHVWGEVTNARNEKRTARITTANGYSLTASGSVAVVQQLLAGVSISGSTTPSKLMGAGFLETLPGSGKIAIS